MRPQLTPLPPHPPLQAWTASGQPPARDLTASRVPDERRAVAELQALLAARAAALGSSVESDQRELEQWEGRGQQAEPGCSSDGSSVGGGAHAESNGSGSSSSDGGGRVAPAGSSGGGGSSRSAGRGRASGGRAAGHGGGGSGGGQRGQNAARMATAVRARLEHKLLLREAGVLLGQYEEYLRRL